MDNGMIKFLYILNRVILYTGFIFFAGCLLYFVVAWNLHDFKSCAGVMTRVLILTIISYLVQKVLSHFRFTNTEIPWEKYMDELKEKNPMTERHDFTLYERPKVDRSTNPATGTGGTDEKH